MFSGYLFAFRPRRGEIVPMFFHPHARSAEHDAFKFESETLFQAVFAGQRDLAARAYHAMPGQPARSAQRPDNLTGATGKTSRARHFAVGGDSAFGNFPNGVANDFQHDARLHRTEGFPPWRTRSCVLRRFGGSRR